MPGLIDNLTVNDFIAEFNVNASTGDFSTTAAKTHGQMTLKNGRICNLNRHGFSSGDSGAATHDAYLLREGLVRALTKDNASAAFIAQVRAQLGLGDAAQADEAGSTAQPLSRRTIKQILASHAEAKTGANVNGLNPAGWKARSFVMPANIANHRSLAEHRVPLEGLRRVYELERLSGRTDEAILADLQKAYVSRWMGAMMRMAFHPEYLTDVKAYLKGKALAQQVMDLQKADSEALNNIKESECARLHEPFCRGVVENSQLVAANADVVKSLGIDEQSPLYRTALNRLNRISAEKAGRKLDELLFEQMDRYVGKTSQIKLQMPNVNAADFCVGNLLADDVRNAIATALKDPRFDEGGKGDAQRAMFLSRVLTSAAIGAMKPKKLSALIDGYIREAKDICAETEGEENVALRKAVADTLNYQTRKNEKFNAGPLTHEEVTTLVATAVRVRNWAENFRASGAKLDLNHLMEFGDLLLGEVNPNVKDHLSELCELAIGVAKTMGAFDGVGNRKGMADQLTRKNVVSVLTDLYQTLEKGLDRDLFATGQAESQAAERLRSDDLGRLQKMWALAHKSQQACIGLMELEEVLSTPFATGLEPANLALYNLSVEQRGIDAMPEFERQTFFGNDNYARGRRGVDGIAGRLDDLRNRVEGQWRKECLGVVGSIAMTPEYMSLPTSQKPNEKLLALFNGPHPLPGNLSKDTLRSAGLLMLRMGLTSAETHEALECLSKVADMQLPASGRPAARLCSFAKEVGKLIDSRVHLGDGARAETIHRFVNAMIRKMRPDVAKVMHSLTAADVAEINKTVGSLHGAGAELLRLFGGHGTSKLRLDATQVHLAPDATDLVTPEAFAEAVELYNQTDPSKYTIQDFFVRNGQKGIDSFDPSVRKFFKGVDQRTANLHLQDYIQSEMTYVVLAQMAEYAKEGGQPQYEADVNRDVRISKNGSVPLNVDGANDEFARCLRNDRTATFASLSPVERKKVALMKSLLHQNADFVYASSHNLIATSKRNNLSPEKFIDISGSDGFDAPGRVAKFYHFSFDDDGGITASIFRTQHKKMSVKVVFGPEEEDEHKLEFDNPAREIARIDIHIPPEEVDRIANLDWNDLDFEAIRQEHKKPVREREENFFETFPQKHVPEPFRLNIETSLYLSNQFTD